jgi:predicted aldo/keto reductase-like oxidoreductase
MISRSPPEVTMGPLRIGVLAIVLSALIGFFVAAHYLWLAMIGLDPSSFPAGEMFQAIGSLVIPSADVALAGVIIALGLVLLCGLATFIAVRRSRRTSVLETDPARRSFMTGTLAGTGAALGAIAAGGGAMFARTLGGVGSDAPGWSEPLGKIFGGEVTKTHPEWKTEWKGARVREYGRLGRTEWRVSDTVLGTGRLKGEAGEKIARLALSRGINYLDTAPDYAGAGSENAIGRAIADHPREELFIATKFCTPLGHLGPGTPVEGYKEAVYGSLERLGTDYVDLIHVHSCDEVERLMDPNMHTAFEELKAEEKVRFLGFSTHTPRLIEVANAAIDSGKFDVMMLAYHHGIWPELTDIIRRARSEQDMGVVAMKTLKGAKHHGLAGFREQADAFSQAALTWTLSNPHVSCAVISFFELQHVDEYLFASGKTLEARDLAILQEYDRQIRGCYCGPHCGACLASCSEGLRVHDVLRHRMYFEDYGWEKEAMRLYAKLEKKASACASCSAPCAGACPAGVSIQERMSTAHQLLTLV